MDPITNAFLLFALGSLLAAAFAAAGWLSERFASPVVEAASPVWSFNNMPAGARVDTARSVRESARGMA